MKVKVPPGVSSGSILRVTGEGDAGPRGYAIFYIYIWFSHCESLQKIIGLKKLLLLVACFCIAYIVFTTCHICFYQLVSFSHTLMKKEILLEGRKNITK
jgi:hypothetical protein